MFRQIIYLSTDQQTSRKRGYGNLLAGAVQLLLQRDTCVEAVRILIISCLETIMHCDTSENALLTQLIPDWLQSIKVLLILLVVLHLLLDSFKDTNGSGQVIDPASCSECALDDLRCWHEIVCETVVEPTLELEEIFDCIEEADVTVREGFKGFFFVVCGVSSSWWRRDTGYTMEAIGHVNICCRMNFDQRVCSCFHRPRTHSEGLVEQLGGQRERPSWRSRQRQLSG